MEKILFWYRNARPVSLPQSMMPALVAAFLSARYDDFKWYLALLSVIGIAFAHLSFNLFDDYFDFKNAQQGDRSALTRMGFRAMTVKCPPLQDGTVSPGKWFKVSCLFAGIACMFGLPVMLVRGPQVLWVVLAVGILGLFYSAPPLKLGYHGLGELVIGSVFGPGIFIGMCLAGAGEFHLPEVLLSCAAGLQVVAILYVHSIMDYAADTKAQKRTLAWLVGCHATIPDERSRKACVPSSKEIEAGVKRQYITLFIILFLPYVLLIICILSKALPFWYALSMLALPWSVSLYISMERFREDPFRVPEKKWWYGRFQHWDEIKKAGIDWFMLRWLLAQRINIIFSLLCIAASVIVIVQTHLLIR